MDALRAALDNLEVQVHVEPIEARSAWQDSALLTVEQKAESSPASPQR